MSEAGEIAAWLRGQAEADVNRAELAGGGAWGTGCTCEGECVGYPSCERVEGADITIYAEGGHDADQAVHIAAHDPLTEIARAESVLAVLDDRERTAAIASPAECPQGETAGRDYLDAKRELAALDHVVRLLAAGYRSREGYKPEWAGA